MKMRDWSQFVSMPIVRKKDYEHSKHVSIPLKVFLSSLAIQAQQQKLSDGNQGKELEDLINEVYAIQQENLFVLKNAVEDIATSIKKLEENLIQNHNNLLDFVKKQDKVEHSIPEVIELIQNGEINKQSELQSKIIHLLNTTQIVNTQLTLQMKASDNMSQKINDFYTQVNLQIKNLQQSTHNQFEDIQKYIEQNLITKNGLLDVQISPSNYVFSQQQKGTDIALSQENKLASQGVTQQYENRFAIIDPALPKGVSSYIAFKVNKIANWVGVGVCLHNKMIKNNMSFNSGYVGHCSYMISNNKYIWSHHISEQNQQTKGFQFTKDAIILVKYNPDTHQVDFIQKNTQNKYSLAMEKLESSDTQQDSGVRFCINLCSEGDSIQIIEFDPSDLALFGDSTVLAKKNENNQLKKKKVLLSNSSYGEQEQVDMYNEEEYDDEEEDDDDDEEDEDVHQDEIDIDDGMDLFD